MLKPIPAREEEPIFIDTGKAPGAKNESPRDISAEMSGSSRDMRPNAEEMAGLGSPEVLVLAVLLVLEVELAFEEPRSGEVCSGDP